MTLREMKEQARNSFAQKPEAKIVNINLQCNNQGAQHKHTDWDNPTKEETDDD